LGPLNEAAFFIQRSSLCSTDHLCAEIISVPEMTERRDGREKRWQPEMKKK
jgi:hypothetical protein